MGFFVYYSDEFKDIRGWTAPVNSCFKFLFHKNRVQLTIKAPLFFFFEKPLSALYLSFPLSSIQSRIILNTHSHTRLLILLYAIFNYIPTTYNNEEDREREKKTAPTPISD